MFLAAHFLLLAFIKNKESCFTGVTHSSTAHLFHLTTTFPGALPSSCFEEVIGQLTSAVSCSRGERVLPLFERRENIGCRCVLSGHLSLLHLRVFGDHAELMCVWAKFNATVRSSELCENGSQWSEGSKHSLSRSWYCFNKAYVCKLSTTTLSCDQWVTFP